MNEEEEEEAEVAESVAAPADEEEVHLVHQVPSLSQTQSVEVEVLCPPEEPVKVNLNLYVVAEPEEGHVLIRSPKSSTSSSSSLPTPSSKCSRASTTSTPSAIEEDAGPLDVSHISSSIETDQVHALANDPEKDETHCAKLDEREPPFYCDVVSLLRLLASIVCKANV